MKNKKKTVRMMLLILCLVIELAYLLIAGGVIILSMQDSDWDVPPVALITMTVHAAALLVTSVCGILQTRREEEWVLGKGFLWKFIATWIAFGFICIPAGGPTMAGVFIVSGCAVIFYALWRRHRTKREEKAQMQRKQQQINRIREKTSKSVSSDDVWEKAAEEYCKLYEKSKDSLTEEEKEKIREYAANPTVYFLTWLIQNDLYSEMFRQECGDELIQRIKAEQMNPAELFKDKLHYELKRDYWSESAHALLNNYFLPNDIAYFYSPTYRRYQDDYFETMWKAEQKVYCADFFWELYHEIAEKITKAFHYEQMDEECDEEPEFYSRVLWKKLGIELEVKTVGAVTPEYVGACIEHLNSLSEDVMERLCDELINDFVEEEMPDITADKRKILEYMAPDTMLIYRPSDDTPAFVMQGESELEEEHGFGWSIRGEEILEVGYRMDISTPWNRENDMAYEMAVMAGEMNMQAITSKEQVAEEVAKGRLQAVTVFPECLGGPKDGEQVYVPSVAAAQKESADYLAKRLLLEGKADFYSCEPEYKENALIPSALKVNAIKDGRGIVRENIQIW